MKKSIILVVFYLAMCSFMYAQSPRAKLDKIKEIKLLESTSEDIKRIFGENEDEDYESVSTENLDIDITYSTGDCSDDGHEEWNIAEGKVTEVEVRFNDPVKPQDLGIDLSRLEKLGDAENDDFGEETKEDSDEASDEDSEEASRNVYYDKSKGISYEGSKKGITRIKFIPTEENYPTLCNNENVREFNSDKEWFRHKAWIAHSVITGFPNLMELTLSRSEVTKYLDSALPENESCANDGKINVETESSSSDPTDVLTYNYTVSGGRIVGEGAKVIWDLSGVEPGKYTITAGVENGCGVCSTNRTQEVIVKEDPNRPQK